MDQPLLYGFSATDVTRNFFFNTGTVAPLLGILIPLLFLLSGVIALYHFRIHQRRWFAASHNSLIKPDREGLRHLAQIIRPAKGEVAPWCIHFLVLTGLFSFLLIESFFVLEGYLLYPLFEIKPFSGYIYLIFTMIQDIAILMISTGVLAGMYRRFISAPSRLDRKPDDALVPIMLLVFVVSRTLVEALRIKISGFPAFEKWSFFTYAISGILPVPGDMATELHYVLWWAFVLTLLAMIALMTTGRFSNYVFTVYARLVNPGLSFANSLGIAGRQGPLAGYKDLDAKDLLDLDACLLCGRCQDRCPAKMSGSSLSPKEVIRSMRLTVLNQDDLGCSVSDEMLRDCLFCGACDQTCPSNISVMSKLLRYRQSVHSEASDISEDGNPFGHDVARRGERLIEQFPELVARPGVEYDLLIFAGCAAAYDENAAEGLVSFIRLAVAAGKKTGIAPQQEMCCGEPAFIAGDMYTFRRLAGENFARLREFSAKTIVTACPHCALTLDQVYRSVLDEADFKDWNIRHHGEVLLDMKREGLIAPLFHEGVITYHDSCRIGRYKEDYDRPRELIAGSAIRLAEMSHCREEALCCGRGGAIGVPERALKGARTCDMRVREAWDSGADMIVTSCQFCRESFNEGISGSQTRNLKVADIATMFKSVAK